MSAGGPRPRRRSPVPPEYSPQSYPRVAARVQQWNRAVPPSTAGYVTLGTVRYGVRVASPQIRHIVQGQQVRQEALPPVGDDRDCCCVGVQLPWNRTRPVSRLPLPMMSSPSCPSSPPASTPSRGGSGSGGVSNNSHRSGGGMFGPAERRPVLYASHASHHHPHVHQVLSPYANRPQYPQQQQQQHQHQQQHQTQALQPVYRSSLEWSQSQAQSQSQTQSQRTKPSQSQSVVTSCFKASDADQYDANAGEDDRYNEVRSPVLGRSRVVVRPKPELPAYFKLCASSASDSDTSCLLSPSDSRDDLASPQEGGTPRRNTLDRLQRFRFGGGRDRRAGSGEGNRSSGKKSRSGDKTERLRELTERLKGNNPKPPPVEKVVQPPPTPPIPPPRHRVPRTPPETLVLYGDCLPECSQAAPPIQNVPANSGNPRTPKIEDCKPVVSPQHSVDVATSTEPCEPSDCANSSGMPREDDLFECVNLQLSKPESRTIVGSYIQRTIPFRSASFSQVDFSADGKKYVRTLPRIGQNARVTHPLRAPPPPVESGSVIASAGLTLPRKRDGSSRSTSPSNKSDSGDSQTNSLTNTDKQRNTESKLEVPQSRKHVENKAEHLFKSNKPPSGRPLTDPLPQQVSYDEEIPYTSIDGNGMKSFQKLNLPQDAATADEAQQVSGTDNESNKQNLPIVDELETIILEVPVLPRNCLLDTSSSTVLPEMNNENSDEINSEYRNNNNEISDNIDTVEECVNVSVDNLETGPENCPAESNGTLLQTATTCIVTVPVYECIVREWSTTHPLEQWVSATESIAEPVDTSDVMETEEPPKLTLDVTKEPAVTSEKPPTPNAEEKKRVVDKSKRRKGIYITQWPTADGEDSPEMIDLKLCKQNSSNGDNSKADDVPKIKTEDLSGGVDYIKPPWSEGDWTNALEESASPDDDAQKPQWPKHAASWKRPPLSCQSSEEKDDEYVRRKYNLLARNDSISDGESDQGLHTPGRDRTASPSPSPFDLSDCESMTKTNTRSHPPRRYSKRPLRGPYGQMLEAEMKKPDASKFSKLQYNEELKFLEEFASPPPQRPSSPNISSSRTSLASTASSIGPDPVRPMRPRPGNHSFDESQLKNAFNQKSQIRTSPKRKVSANIPYSAPNPGTTMSEPGRVAHHQRTTSSPSQLENCAQATRRGPEPSSELLEQLLKGSSERTARDTSGLDGIPACVQRCRDTRTHVVVELFETERSYVEALQILVVKYLQPLKSPENAGLVESTVVDEIFYMVPAILAVHEVFLEELRRRLELWDAKQKVGDIFLEVFSNASVMDTYTAFINNWKKANEAIKSTSAAKPAFVRFLEAMARENKGKLALDNLLIKPVQKFPKYELLLQRLIKHTDPDHPDHKPLLDAQRQVHDLLVKINCTERKTLEFEQQQNYLREIEGLVEGLINLVATDRSYIRNDLVSMHSGQGTRKERALFLFSDLLVITSIKRRSGTIRKPPTTCPGSIAGTLDANKYKLLMRISLDDMEIMKVKDENIRRAIREMETLSDDLTTLTQISELAQTLRCSHNSLDDAIRDLQSGLARQLADRQATDTQLSYLEMTINTASGIENISVVFSKPETRASWEEAFNEAKQKLALSADRRPAPEFVSPVPIRKTRAGLQFTCAAPTLCSMTQAHASRDVWVCNSDGYVGQVCVLSLYPEPTVTSCNGVCNARILCVASVPAGISGQVCTPVPHFTNIKTGISISIENADDLSGNIELDSGTSSEDEDYVSEGVPETEQSAPPSPEPPGSISEDPTDSLLPTMWLGTEDGCIHVYNCTDNIRIKKNKIKIQHGSAVYSIIYLDNKVFVSLANGDISIYTRDQTGWNTNDPLTVSIGTSMAPVTKLLPVAGRLWCATHNHIKVLNTQTLQVDTVFQINTDTNKPITNLAMSGLGVWVSLQNSAILKCFHATSHECLFEVNIAPSVTKMLAGCDDIIRQHKAACLRVTALLACKDLLWVGTSAGVILTMPMPHVGVSTTGKNTTMPIVTGVPHGHTGHVRFLTYIENNPAVAKVAEHPERSPCHRYSMKTGPPAPLKGDLSVTSGQANTVAELVISGGDGYEDFRNVGASEVAGREDSTNHLLLWQV